MPTTYDLTQLDAHSFEHMVNALALKILGKGVTGLAPGADAGRDGYFVGEAAYPSEIDCWSGTWYIQSKFHGPHLSKDPQKWLIAEAKKEIKEFKDNDKRKTPNIWIIASNIDPSGAHNTGAFDSIRDAVLEELGSGVKFDIWGGRKILNFLLHDPDVANYYGHFLTPGHVLSAMYQQIGDASAQVKPIINHLILDQFNDQIYTKLEQAGGTGPKPKIHELFVDLPAKPKEYEGNVNILETLVAAAANVHKPSAWARFGDGWRTWANHPKRARAIILKGGPGQGKSTAGQFFCQIQRAALLLESGSITVLPSDRETAIELLNAAEELSFKPSSPRIPISIELKDFAGWHGTRLANQSKGILTYLCEKISSKIDQPVEGGTLKRAFETRSWFVNFDGLDEVPNDVKDQVADEVIRFVNVSLPQLDADVLILCTTRPQGYSDQFKDLNATTLELTPLPSDVALKCAEGVVRFANGNSEAESRLEVLKSAMDSPPVRQLMTTPLQSHIMAVVVKDGGRPPERRWELFENFYQVMKRRESLKNFPDTKIAQLLREKSVLLKAIHSRLGICLHSAAEQSLGAETTLSRDQFERLTRQTAEKYEDDNIDTIVNTLMEATVQRLVFVSTPECSTSVRFDIRQLQEFFAAEFLYYGATHQSLLDRLNTIGSDPHWREVMHFVVSALVVTARPTELTIAISTILAMDNSDISPELRAYHRRVGNGALLTLRLLHEGVLEQERSIRSQFKETLTPIYGILDSEVFDSLCSLRHPNTVAWLLNGMTDALFELSEPEQINAAAVLAAKLPCNSSKREAVENKIRNSSSEYINGLYTLILGENNYPFMPQHRGQGQKWFIELTFDMLFSEVAQDGVKLNLLIRYLRSTIRKHHELDIYNIQEDMKPAAWIILHHKLTKTDETQTFKIHDLLHSTPAFNWKSEKLPSELEQLKLFGKSIPVQILQHYLSFFKERQVESLRQLLALTIKHDADDILTQSVIAQALPYDPYFTKPEHALAFLRNLDQASFNELLEQDPHPGAFIRPCYELLQFGAAKNPEQFEAIATTHPNIALGCWLGVFDFSDSLEYSKLPELIPIIEKLIHLSPKAMFNCFAGWGIMASDQPELFTRILPTLREHAPATASPFGAQKIAPFILSMPSDLVFLPLVAKVILNSLRLGEVHRHDRSSLIKQTLASYGLDIDTLSAIQLNELIPLEQRAGAFACRLIFATQSDNPSSLIPITELKISVTDFLNSGLTSWLVELLSCALPLMNYSIEDSREIIGGLLISCRERYEDRMELQHLIANFRERSLAPVSSRKVLESWLN